MKHLIIDILLAPILGIIAASVILFFVGYTNWHKGMKEKIISWIETKIFRKSFDSKGRAEGLFGVITAQLLMAGLLMIIAAIYILTNANY